MDETALQKMVAALQGHKHISTSDIPAPSLAAKIMSSSFQERHLTVMWSNGLLQAFNTALRPTTAGSTLAVHTSRHLPAFDLGSKHMLIDDAQEEQQQQQGQQQLAGKKKRKAAAATVLAKSDDHAALDSFVPMLVPLGGHSVMAIREPKHLPTNGHASANVEATVADTQYGCVQSVTGIKLPGHAGSAGSTMDLGGLEQDALQLRSGMGNLVLLVHNAVWYISIPVSLLTRLILPLFLPAVSINESWELHFKCHLSYRLYKWLLTAAQYLVSHRAEPAMLFLMSSACYATRIMSSICSKLRPALHVSSFSVQSLPNQAAHPFASIAAGSASTPRLSSGGPEPAHPQPSRSQSFHPSLW